MPTIINGDSPSITFSDTTTQTTAFTTNPTVNNIKSQAATPLTFAINATEAGRFDTTGKFLVGTTTVNGTEILQLKAAGVQWAAGPNTTNGNFDVLNGSGTGVYLANGGTSWIGLSDETVKDIIEPINGAVSKVNTLRSVIGKYKIDEEGTRRSFLIAQDVQAVFPEAVNTNHDGKLGISYTDVIPLLVAAIKELNAKVDAQAEQIKSLVG
jgi:uncharacterized protein YaaQ